MRKSFIEQLAIGLMVVVAVVFAVSFLATIAINVSHAGNTLLP